MWWSQKWQWILSLSWCLRNVSYLVILAVSLVFIHFPTVLLHKVFISISPDQLDGRLLKGVHKRLAKELPRSALQWPVPPLPPHEICDELDQPSVQASPKDLCMSYFINNTGTQRTSVDFPHNFLRWRLSPPSCCSSVSRIAGVLPYHLRLLFPREPAIYQTPDPFPGSPFLFSNHQWPSVLSILSWLQPTCLLSNPVFN